MGFQDAERTDRVCPPVRVLWLESVDREKTVTDFPWAVARSGRVGCGVDDHARSCRSGLRGVNALRCLFVAVAAAAGAEVVAEVGMVGDGWFAGKMVPFPPRRIILETSTLQEVVEGSSMLDYRTSGTEALFSARFVVGCAGWRGKT